MGVSLEEESAQICAMLRAATGPGDVTPTLHFVAKARRACRTDLALDAVAAHLTRAPDHPDLLFAEAQLRYESGLPAAAHFDRLLARTPSNLRLVAATAAARAADGEEGAAEALLIATLGAHPDWVDGHHALSALRWRRGAPAADFAQSFADASIAQPQNRALWLAWFHIMAQAKAWDAARGIVDAAGAHLGRHQSLELARLFLASESGAVEEAERLFASVEALDDPGLNLCRVRFGLRHGKLDWAEAAAMRLLASAAAPNAWPYLSAIWRLKGGPRAQWLDAPDRLIQTYDLALTDSDIGDLQALVRSIITVRAPQLDQSVRGGAQTEQPLFYRHEPVVWQLRLKIESAIRAYIAALPSPADDTHPLLGLPRATGTYFSGSWAVWLRSSGHHVAHTHPAGWLSSALYLALPTRQPDEPERAGWINFGAPPPELGTGLAAYRSIEPRVGHLVLFPSTMWHATEPFAAGDRMVVAFDVRPHLLPGAGTR